MEKEISTFNNLSKEEIVHYLATDKKSEINKLFKKADETRKKFVGDVVHIRGIIEASNICKKDCLYCGIRKSNKKVKRYKLTTEQIFRAIKKAVSLGYKSVVIQTGEAKIYSIKEMCNLIKRIKNSFDIAITLSLGELSKAEYQAFWDSGADRYLLRFETSDEELFRKLKPDGNYKNRMQSLKWLKEIGYQVGSGIMVGLPTQSLKSVAEDILLFATYDLDMVGCGPFIANGETPLGGKNSGSLLATLKLIALTRIITQNAHIPATTALGTIDPQGRQLGLKCGANVIMPNCTPTVYRKNYLLYPNKICISEKPSDCVTCIKYMVESQGRFIGTNRGDSLKRGYLKQNREFL